MFSNKNKNAAKNGKTYSGEDDINAFLGAGSEFEGRIMFNERTRIDGAFRGEISSNDLLVIGESAKLNADIRIGSLIISGFLQGNIIAHTGVELRAPAHIRGNIQTPSISIEDGVTFNGEIIITNTTAG